MHVVPARQGDTIHFPPLQAMDSWALRHCGSDLAGTQSSPGWGIPVSQVRAEPIPLQRAGPRQACSVRHTPPAHVSTES